MQADMISPWDFTQEDREILVNRFAPSLYRLVLCSSLRDEKADFRVMKQLSSLADLPPAVRLTLLDLSNLRT